MERLFDLIEQLKSRCVKNELIIMEEANISLAEYNGISALDPEERVCGNDLSRKMNLSPSRASRVIDKLVKNGYLLREGDAADRRRCTISFFASSDISTYSRSLSSRSPARCSFR